MQNDSESFLIKNLHCSSRVFKNTSNFVNFLWSENTIEINFSQLLCFEHFKNMRTKEELAPKAKETTSGRTGTIEGRYYGQNRPTVGNRKIDLNTFTFNEMVTLYSSERIEQIQNYYRELKKCFSCTSPGFFFFEIIFLYEVHYFKLIWIVNEFTVRT